MHRSCQTQLRLSGGRSFDFIVIEVYEVCAGRGIGRFGYVVWSGVSDRVTDSCAVLFSQIHLPVVPPHKPPTT
jgi:hypothetical protein